jgi:hypothetical protein
MSTTESGLRAFRGTKITSSDPPLTAVRTAYPAPPLPPFPDPPIERATRQPRGRLDLDRWVDCPAISLGPPLQIIVAEVHS